MPAETTDNRLETWRLFVALSLPEAVKAELRQAQTVLRQGLPERGVRWTTPDQFHLTLKFLGNVEAARVAALGQALEAVGRQFGPLSLRAEGIGFFPGARSPRVVWAGVRDAREDLPRLQQAVEEAVGEFTAEKPESKFSGHVTLGRVKQLGRREVERLVELASPFSAKPFGEWAAQELELIRSQLTPAGSKYSIAQAARLGP